MNLILRRFATDDTFGAEVMKTKTGGKTLCEILGEKPVSQPAPQQFDLLENQINFETE